MTWRLLTHQALGSALGSVGSLLRLPSRGSGGGSADSLEDSSSEEEEEPPSAPTGFKLNLGKVAANQVDDAKPVAVPHTPKGEVVRGLEPWRRSQGSQDSSIDGGDGGGEESEVESSSEEEDLGPPPGPTGFKLNLGKVAANQVDDAKPVAKPHTPREEVVQGLLAAQSGGSIGGEGSEVESSSEEEDLGPPSGPTGFKLNLGKVAVNQVDDAKPVAKPHTPREEVVQGLLAQQGSSGAASALPEDGGARGVSEGEESSEGDDEEPPPASTGFKIDLSRVGKSVVDGAKPVAVPHTPKGDVVQGILAKQRSIGAAVGTARPHVTRAASVATVRPGRSHRLPRGSWAIGSCRYDLASAHPPGTWLGAGQCGVAAQAAEQGQWWRQR